MESQDRHHHPQHGVYQTDGDEIEERGLGHRGDKLGPSKALLDITIEIKGSRSERHSSLAKRFGHGVGDGIVGVDDGEQSGLIEVVAAETDLEGGLDDGGLLSCGGGVVEFVK